MTKKRVLFLLTLMVLLLLGGMLFSTPARAAGPYQAENAVLGGGAVVQSTYTGYSGTGYVDFPDTYNMAYVEFRNVDGGTGGSRVLRLRYALGGASVRSGLLFVNGVRQIIKLSPTGAWTTWAIRELVVTLTPGASNTIRLLGQYLPNLDQLEVSSLVCSPVTSIISVPHTYNGIGTFCWETDNPGDYINSWNVERLTINGVDITNSWTGSSSYPPAINGKYYIGYTGNFPWSHVEVRLWDEGPE